MNFLIKPFLVLVSSVGLGVAGFLIYKSFSNKGNIQIEEKALSKELDKKVEDVLKQDRKQEILESVDVEISESIDFPPQPEPFFINGGKD